MDILQKDAIREIANLGKAEAGEVDIVVIDIPDVPGLAAGLATVPGVVEHGLFIGLAKAIIVADAAGVEILGDLA